jgi:hypothetical protein
MAGRTGKQALAANAKIHTAVHIGEPAEVPGFGIAVDIEVEGVPDEQLIQDAHAVCVSRHFVCEACDLNLNGLVYDRHALTPELLVVAHRSPSRASKAKKQNTSSCRLQYESCVVLSYHRLFRSTCKKSDIQFEEATNSKLYCDFTVNTSAVIDRDQLNMTTSLAPSITLRYSRLG